MYVAPSLHLRDQVHTDVRSLHRVLTLARCAGERRSNGSSQDQSTVERRAERTLHEA